MADLLTKMTKQNCIWKKNAFVFKSNTRLFDWTSLVSLVYVSNILQKWQLMPY